MPDISNFYILHEGLVATLDDELIEEDYDDIQENKFSKTAQKGWLGIGDKYWVTSLIPPREKEFKTTFDYKDKFRANFVSTEPLELNENSLIEETLQIIVAAKRVDVIDGYAESLNIDKFDLTIDWGFLYFITKPLFFGIDYFFKLLGNYGLAIIAITICIRLAFFPLANFSFRSMAKMKALQPEMARLKELHKDDKMKLQQAMMALYKKEKVNPMSGCLPILVQIPVFFALYKVLFVTIEMRQMPFYGWIQDLSERDPTSLFTCLVCFFMTFHLFNDWSMANCNGCFYVYSTKIKSGSNRSNASKNIYVLSFILNDNFSTFPCWIGNLLDS